MVLKLYFLFPFLLINLVYARREFKKVEMPIAFCSAENMFMLDKWTIRRECPNDDYLYPGTQTQNCKKDNWNQFMTGDTNDLSQKTNNREQFFKNIQDEKLKEFAQKRHAQISQDANIDDMIKRSKISDQEYEKIKQKNDELFKQYQQTKKKSDL